MQGRATAPANAARSSRCGRGPIQQESCGKVNNTITLQHMPQTPKVCGEMRGSFICPSYPLSFGLVVLSDFQPYYFQGWAESTQPFLNAFFSSFKRQCPTFVSDNSNSYLRVISAPFRDQETSWLLSPKIWFLQKHKMANGGWNLALKCFNQETKFSHFCEPLEESKNVGHILNFFVCFSLC